MARVFISYSREREATVRDLAEDVGSLGNSVWFDEALSGGQRWWDRILETIRDCDVFVMLLDPDSLASTACRREYDYAHALGKPILPVLVSDDVKVSLLPPALAEIQHVDYRGDGREALRRLAKALPALPEPPALPDPLPPPPEAPLSYLGGLAEKLSADADLSFEQQSALVSELRLSLRDPETAADGRVLLERMRSRRDLFAAIADEIDELQAEPAAAVTTRPDTEPEVNAVPPVEQGPATVQSTESPPKRALLRNVALGGGSSLSPVSVPPATGTTAQPRRHHRPFRPASTSTLRRKRSATRRSRLPTISSTCFGMSASTCPGSSFGPGRHARSFASSSKPR